MTILYVFMTILYVFMRYNISGSQGSTNLKKKTKAMKEFVNHL